jgi:hypothetical protein
LFLAGDGNNIIVITGGGTFGNPLREFVHIQVAAFLPDLVLLSQQGADQPQGGIIIGEDANHPFPAAYFLVQPLLHIRGAQSLAVLLRQRHHGHRVFKAGLQTGHRLGCRLGKPLTEFR